MDLPALYSAHVECLLFGLLPPRVISVFVNVWCVCKCVQVRGWYWMSSSLTFHLVLRQSLSLNLELTICLDWLLRKPWAPPAPAALGSQLCTAASGVLHEFWGSEGPHACTASTCPPRETFPLPWAQVHSLSTHLNFTSWDLC